LYVGSNENTSIFSGPEDLPSVVDAASAAGVRVAVLADARNARYMDASHFEAELRLWPRWLADLGAKLVPVSSADVLVLPYLLCRDPAISSRVREHLAKGGGIITVGAFGARNEQCAEGSDTLLFALTGGGPGSGAALTMENGGPVYLGLLGETVLGANLPPGARLELRPAHQLAFRDRNRDLYFAGFDRQPRGNPGAAYFDGAVTRATAGGGRVVAFGFGLAEIVPGWSTAIGRGVVANALLWAAGRPVVHVAAWPNGAEAAALIAQDVEDEFARSAAAAAVVAAAGLPQSSFIVGDLARAHPATTGRLAALGEVGTHTSDHEPLAELSKAAQRSKLEAAQEQLHALAGEPAVGLRPPGERYDLATVAAWAAAGGEYIVAANRGRAAAPELIPAGRDTVVLLGRSSPDDFAIVNRGGLRSPDHIAASFAKELSIARANRGLFIFSFHSILLAREEMLPVVQAVTEQLSREPTVWTATGGDIAQWWRARARIEIRVAAGARSAIVRNTGSSPVSGAVLIVDGEGGVRRTIALPDLLPAAEIIVPFHSAATAARPAS
jgi:peptidoglycan/xylan/chitin deacetylase (PgdA/CDA1 family)